MYRKSVHMHHKAKNEKRISHQVYVLVYIKNTFKEGVQQTPRTIYEWSDDDDDLYEKESEMYVKANGNWGNVLVFL